ncbi:Crp/Fnr family transcriptional regulator [Treponema parvum]|uniref:Crp/Fnr family transcriptional regulator n=1 Tax=Treponema parvum TaxID=138851 RepID=A0A975EZS2_9SPIR|nr:Crp/Fnr family transcriptional regulator [Treponema parvum]QTQ11424.1 Crp/Fnr family transcriptional regulator [Treponema parvum]QTQ14397.1 Crp/Fnr family transcriptional regulator [Treponema parvum]QTQ16635.1 Crp/Fnr family transcriptional regulator [Treponema parvum]
MSAEGYYTALEKSKLFQGLSAKEIKDGIDDISYDIRRFEEGEIIYHLMAKADRIGIILKGRAQAQKIYSNGDQFYFSVRVTGDIIGPVAAFSRLQRYPFEVRALEPTEILVFECTGFLRLLQSDVRVMKNFLIELASANFLLQQRLELLTYNAIQHKIAFYLLTAYTESGRGKILIPDSMTRWALMMNVSRPSLHRELKKMEALGLLRYLPPMIEIADSEGLKKLLEQ